MMVSTSSSVLILLTFLFPVGDQRTDGFDSQLLVLEIVRYFQETVWEVSLANLDIEIYAGMWQGMQGGGFYDLVQQEGIRFSLPFICAGFGSCLVLHHVTYLTDSLLSFLLLSCADRWQQGGVTHGRRGRHRFRISVNFRIMCRYQLVDTVVHEIAHVVTLVQGGFCRLQYLSHVLIREASL